MRWLSVPMLMVSRRRCAAVAGFTFYQKCSKKQEAPEYDAPWKSRIFCDSLQRHYPHQVQGSKVYLPLCLSHKLPLLCCYGRIIHLCPPAHKYILIRRSIRALYPSNPGASYSLKIEHLVPGEVEASMLLGQLRHHSGTRGVSTRSRLGV